MVQVRLGLGAPPEPADAADAAALALCHLAMAPLRARGRNAAAAAAGRRRDVIGSLRGTVLERSPDGEVLVEVGGVGYRVTVTPRTLAALEPDDDAFLYVHHHIREDAQTLYGFLGRDERACFEVLIGAHGVGPALGAGHPGRPHPGRPGRLVALGATSPRCASCPGVGRKTAARLLLELQSRLSVSGAADAVAAGDGTAVSSAVADVREALAGLGYGPDEMRDVLRERRPVGPRRSSCCGRR